MCMETPEPRDSAYVQDSFAQNFVQGAGIIGLGWPFGRPDVFWKNATNTRGLRY